MIDCCFLFQNRNFVKKGSLIKFSSFIVIAAGEESELLVGIKNEGNAF